MGLKYQLKNELKQKQLFLPEMIESINILGMSAEELDSYIEAEMLENPLLERSEELSLGDDPTNFQSFGSYSGSKNLNSDNDDDYNSGNMYEKTVAAWYTLDDLLMQQLADSELVGDARILAEYLIKNLDPDGYLRIEYPDLKEKFDLSEDEFDKVISELQSFEPIGVFARSLQECIMLQMESIGFNDEASRYIVENMLEEIAYNKIEDISSKTGLKRKKVQEIADAIRNTNPRPGTAYGSREKTCYVSPDIYLREENGRYVAYNNELKAPKLFVSQYYREILNGNDSDETKKYIRNRLKMATSIIMAINKRKETIRKIADVIANEEIEYFRGKEKFLRPLTLRKVAEKIEMHESTVCRAVNGKYMQTPAGTFELKFFFARGIESDVGEISSISIKKMIKDIIDSEDKSKPVSDEFIRKVLLEKGIHISRRTVAKYRGQLKIGSSSKRKRFY